MRDCASIGTNSHVHYAHHKMMIKTSNLPLCSIEVWCLRSRVKYMRSLGWFPKLNDQGH